MIAVLMKQKALFRNCNLLLIADSRNTKQHILSMCHTINPWNRRRRLEPLSITYHALRKAQGNLGKQQKLSALTGTQKFSLHDYYIDKIYILYLLLSAESWGLRSRLHFVWGDLSTVPAELWNDILRWAHLMRKDREKQSSISVYPP